MSGESTDLADPEMAGILSTLCALALGEDDGENRSVSIDELRAYCIGEDVPYLSAIAELLVNAGYVEREGLGYAPTARGWSWAADRDHEMAARKGGK
jgi:hypothetical protein